MLSQKIQIIPEISNPISNSINPFVFWKKFQREQEDEIHLFLVVECRTTKETEQLGKELWEISSSQMINSLLQYRTIVNPESLCEEILKMLNQHLFNWSQQNQMTNWNSIHVLIGVACGNVVHFAKIGEARMILWREQQMILADENLTSGRSPDFAPPFSEIASGSLNVGDRFLIASPSIMQILTWEELSSLTMSLDLDGAFRNLIRSLEIVANPKNIALLFGEIVPNSFQSAESFNSVLLSKVKESQISGLNITEFNPLSISNNFIASSPSILPWKEILGAGGGFIGNVLKKIFTIIKIPLTPFQNKFNTLSKTRKIILVGGLSLFIVFLSSIGYFFLKKPTVKTQTIDYKSEFEKAESLIDDANNALIYQDQDKARKLLKDADSYLEEVSQSGDWGIKAIKLRKDVAERLSTLDKAEYISQAPKLWDIPKDKGVVKNVFFQNNNFVIQTDKGLWKMKNGDFDKAEEIKSDLNFADNRYWMIPIKNDLLTISPQNKELYDLDLGNFDLSDKKTLNYDKADSLNSVATYENFAYFWDSNEKQIKQFVYSNGNLSFRKNWLVQDLEEDLDGDDVVGLALDGNIFAITKKGRIIRLSGGKVASSDWEQPATPYRGEKIQISTKDGFKNLYVLDPEHKRIIVYEKETGKMLSQLQSDNIGQALGFSVDESKNEIYFVNSTTLFKVNFQQ